MLLTDVSMLDVVQWLLAGAALLLAVDLVGRDRRADPALARAVGALALATGVYVLVTPIVLGGSPDAQRIALWCQMLAGAAGWLTGATVAARLLEVRLPRWALPVLTVGLVTRILALGSGVYVETYVPGEGPTYGAAMALSQVPLLLAGAAVAIELVRSARRARTARTGALVTSAVVALAVLTGVALVPTVRELGLGIMVVVLLVWATVSIERLEERAEAARAHAEDVARRVTERLTRTEEDLEAARRAGADLIDASNHELRTPLTVILGSVETLRRRELDDTQETLLLDVVQRNAERLRELVEYLLAAQTARNVERLPSPTTTAMDRITQEAVRLHPGAAIAAAVAPGVTAHVDPVDAVTITVALVSNAVHHGGNRVVVEAEQDDEHTRLRVRDDGDGVPSTFVPELFRPFHRPSAGLHREPGGLGLGLALARDRAIANGGDVRYERDDDWTVFTLELPRHDGVPPVTDRRRRASNGSPRRRERRAAAR